MALVLGIIALVLTFIFPIAGIIVAIVGIIIGASALKSKDKNAIIGLVLSCIALVLSALFSFTAIKATTSTIDNSRKDTFATLTQNYINSVRNAYLADELECSTTASETGEFKVPDKTANGEYYMFFASSSNAITSNFSSFDSELASKAASNTSELMEFGANSPWGNKEVYGWVHWIKTNEGITYYAALTDVDGHGVSNETKDQNIRRANIEVKNAKADVTKALNSIQNGVNYCHYKG